MKRKRKLLRTAAMLLLTVLIFAATAQAQEGAENPNQLTLRMEIEGQPALVADGKAEAKLPDGTTVTVEGEKLPEELLLVVDIVGADRGELLAWIENCMKDKGTNLRAYDVYFIDGNGKRYELTEEISITISLNGAYARPAVYYVALDGRTELLNSTVENDRISFVTAYDGYYALVEQEEDSTEPDATEPGSTEPDSTEPDSTEPDSTEPDSTEPDATEPDSTEPDSTEPDATEPDSTEPDSTKQETKPTPTPGTNSGTGTGSTTGVTQGTGAKTGDETNLAVLVVMLLLSGAAGFLCILKKTKDRA